MPQPLFTEEEIRNRRDAEEELQAAIGVADEWLVQAKFLLLANKMASESEPARLFMTGGKADASEAQRHALGLFKKAVDDFKSLTLTAEKLSARAPAEVPQWDEVEVPETGLPQIRLGEDYEVPEVW